MGGWEKRRGEWEEDGASEGKGRGQPLPPPIFWPRAALVREHISGTSLAYTFDLHLNFRESSESCGHVAIHYVLPVLLITPLFTYFYEP